MSAEPSVQPVCPIELRWAVGIFGRPTLEFRTYPKQDANGLIYPEWSEWIKVPEVPTVSLKGFVGDRNDD